jgi:hypothetical protein
MAAAFERDGRWDLILISAQHWNEENLNLIVCLRELLSFFFFSILLRKLLSSAQHKLFCYAI